MSSAAAGKFQDHYKILGIDPKATADIVQLAFNALKNVYHPKLGTEPNQEKFSEINLALEVLLDPQARKMFDAVRGGEDEREIIFTGMKFFEGLQLEKDRRMTMLCVLYDVRCQNPRVPMVTMRQFEKIVDMTEGQIQMCLWYLKTLGWIFVDDKSKMQITAQGMDYLEANQPDPATIWPHLKNPVGPAPGEEPLPEPITTEIPAGLANLSSAVQAFSEPPKLKPLSMIRRTSIGITEA